MKFIGLTTVSEKAKFWTEQNTAFEESGMKMHAFCKVNNLKYENFSKWRARLKDRGVLPNRRHFVPVQLMNMPSSQDDIMRLCLRHEISLEIPVGIAIEDLQKIFQSLGVDICGGLEAA